MQKQEQSSPNKNESNLALAIRSGKKNRKFSNNRKSSNNIQTNVSVQSNEQRLVTFYLDFQPPQISMQSIQFQIGEDFTISQALLIALDKFNEIFLPLGYQFDLREKNYGVRLARKNGKPKLDLPCFQLKQKIRYTKTTRLTIQIKNALAIRQLKKEQQTKYHEQQKVQQRIETQINLAKKQTEISPEMNERNRNKSWCFNSAC